MRYETPVVTKMCLSADEASCRPYACTDDPTDVYVGRGPRNWEVGPVCLRGPISINDPGDPTGHLLA